MANPITIDLGAKALGKALRKLLDVCASGVGAIARPWIMRRDARAAVDVALIEARGEKAVARLRSESTAEADPGVTEIIDRNAIAEDALPEAPFELVRQTRSRLEYQEAKRTLNVKRLIEATRSHLDDVSDDQVSDAQVDEDWIARFFTYAQDVSDAQMRELWSRLLAGEIAQPATHSVRALDVLRSMSVVEAKLFEKACAYVANHMQVIRAGEGEPGIFDLIYSDFLALEDAGLVSSDASVVNRFDATQQKIQLLYSDRVLFAAREKEPSTPKFSMPVFPLTAAGRDLSRLFKGPSNHRHVLRVAEAIRTRGLTVTVHRIVSMSPNDNFNFETAPIESEPAAPTDDPGRTG